MEISSDSSRNYVYPHTHFLFGNRVVVCVIATSYFVVQCERKVPRQFLASQFLGSCEAYSHNYKIIIMCRSIHAACMPRVPHYYPIKDTCSNNDITTDSEYSQFKEKHDALTRCTR